HPGDRGACGCYGPAPVRRHHGQPENMKDLEWCSLHGGQNRSSPETPPPPTQFVPWPARRHRSPTTTICPRKKFGVTDKVVCALFGLSPSEHPMTDACDLPRKGPTDRIGTYGVESHFPRPWSPCRSANLSTFPPKTCPDGCTGPSTLDRRHRPLSP